MTEYIVDFGDDRSSAFVRLAMAQAEASGARLQEEIVRCRDCKHYKDRNGAILPSTVCQRLGYYNFKVEPDGFCKWASRRES